MELYLINLDIDNEGEVVTLLGDSLPTQYNDAFDSIITNLHKNGYSGYRRSQYLLDRNFQGEFKDGNYEYLDNVILKVKIKNFIS